MDVLIHVNEKDQEAETQINLDELYERKQQRDLNTLDSYNKILNRIHTRIKTVSRHQINEQFCWYIIPEVMIGIPKFDHGACVAYIISKLRENGFNVRYTHPNLLYISWDIEFTSKSISNNKHKNQALKDNNNNFKLISDYKPSGKFLEKLNL